MPSSVTPSRNLTAVSTYGLSPALWGSFPILDIKENPGKGMFFYDDFQDLPLDGTQTTQIGYGKYKVFNSGTSGSKVKRVHTINSAQVLGGALRINLAASADSGSIAQAFPGYLMTGLLSNSGKLVFECCFSQNSVLANMASGFFGLAETDLWTLATGVPFNAGDAITNSAAAIGFRVTASGLGVVDTVRSDRATSFTNIGAGEAGTIVPFTFAKYGFVYDPKETTNCVRFFLNNQELPTKLSKSSLTGFTNLNANALGLIWAECAGSAGTSYEGYMKWWAVGQVFQSGY